MPKRLVTIGEGKVEPRILDLEGKAREDIVDYSSKEVILEKGKTPSLETLERIRILRLELVEIVLTKSIDPYLSSFLENSLLGREVVSILFSILGEEN